MSKIFNIGIVVLGVICFIFWYLLLGSTDPYADILFYVSYALLAVAIIATLVWTLVNIFSSGEKVKRTLIGVGALVLVVVLGYVFAGSDNIDYQLLSSQGISVTESTSKTVGAGLIMFYILALVAILAMVLSGVKKMIK
ncbi:hypothetical protein SAMN05216480_10878 [Pustulibacterium marinum]|uniref:Uncharacterized protein n=1 Tax=Pustulibacterium marinum TaxID=1224947 RepID=A0A1I7HC26_9FLAO|nr:hypothetical protein [Pustulibacterium marinum]SFU58026.1 hypothetical protein SAMN05216480_10878 [Pustulibacterium marinum]